jgi:hypothetical protein
MCFPELQQQEAILDSRTEANLNRIASDVHLLTAPLRFIWHALLVTLVILSFPLLCALISMHYVIGNVNLVWAYCHFMSTHHIPDALYPFVLLGGFALVAVQAVVGAVQAVAEIFDAMWRWQPLFGITLLALVNSTWMLLVRVIYACIDKETLSNVATRWFAFFGFILSLLGQFYVLPYRETAPPAALFVLATGASASPLLIYLLYRAFKPNACR